MKKLKIILLIVAALVLIVLLVSYFIPPQYLTSEEKRAAAASYQQYCALCHGADRQGHVNDHAPSLKSQSLLEVGYYERMRATSYGRPGTPMAGFHEDVGGPLSDEEIEKLTIWLNVKEGVEFGGLSMDSVSGNEVLGKTIYEKECSECHGANGEGVTGTALGNPAMLSLTRDAFLRHAIVNGRQGTQMPAFADRLSRNEIDAVTAFLRSRATGWNIQKPVLRVPPAVEDYVLNPGGSDPEFELKDGMYVMSADLYKAMQEKRRMVILDTRSMGLWQLSNIEGSVPLPYYYDDDDVDALAADLPKDGTWIVIYCECPRAAAEFVNKKLVALGFENTAVLWEGAFGWVGLGYPVARGEVTELVMDPVLSD